MAKDLLAEYTGHKNTYKPFKRTDDIDFKRTFGEVPKSIMKFKKDKFLMDLIGNDDSELGKVEGDAKPRGGGYAKELRYSIYNPLQAKFIIEYYTEPGYLILDPFMGRGTRPVVSLYTGRDYYGYDTSSKTIELNTKLIKENLDTKDRFCKLVHGDGTKLEHHPDEMFDAVFSCPPYYWVEQYSGEEGDLSKINRMDFDNRIEEMFQQLHRIVKTSNYQERKFHPVIFTVGTLRSNTNGLLDMDYNFQTAAKKAGFVLYDKLFTENNSPGAGFTFRRNYHYGFLTKNYETTLIFMKFNTTTKNTEDEILEA
jgi:DNA modification methylase